MVTATKIENSIFNARRYTCLSGVAITKGDLLMLSDNTASLGTGVAPVFAGVCAGDKSASDYSESISVWTDGIFDIPVAPNITCSTGDLLVLSGQYVIPGEVAQVMSGALVGKALETASAGETIRVSLGRAI